VNDHELQPCAEVTAADWLRPRLRRFASAVSAVVPDGFPAYVRLLHPAQAPEGQPVRWAEVAAWPGAACIGWRSSMPSAGRHRRHGPTPRPGTARLAARQPLGRDHGAPRLHPRPASIPCRGAGRTRVRLPGRDYLLFAGPLAAAPRLGWTDPYGYFFPQSPNLFWPTDHAWCVATEPRENLRGRARIVASSCSGVAVTPETATVSATADAKPQ
jgi:hypothetical protein